MNVHKNDRPQGRIVYMPKDVDIHVKDAYVHTNAQEDGIENDGTIYVYIYIKPDTDARSKKNTGQNMVAYTGITGALKFDIQSVLRDIKSEIENSQVNLTKIQLATSWKIQK